MKIMQRAGLSLLLLSFSALPAAAALSGENGDGDVSIETVTGGTLQSLDQILGGGNNSDPFGSVIQQHAGAAQSSISTTAGSSLGSAGAEKPVTFGAQSPASQTMPPAPVTPPAKAPDFSLKAALNMGVSAQGEASASAPAQAPSTPASAPYSISTPSDDKPASDAPVPVPAAGALLGSGLLASHLMRRLRQD